MDKNIFNNVKKTFLTLGICFSTVSIAQVGVDTTTPRGALDVSSTTQGIVFPNVALVNINTQTAINPQGGAIPAGTVVYNTATSGTAPNNVAPGLYYWNGSRWVAFAGSPGGLDWSLTGNSGTTAGTNFLGTTDAQDLRLFTNNIERIRIRVNGNVGINTVGDAVDRLAVVDVDYAINGYGNGTASNHTAIYANQSGMGSTVWGENFKTVSDGIASIFGESELTIDPGIEGRNNFGNNNSVAVLGNFNVIGTFDGIGVRGQSTPSAGWGFGVYGEGNFYGVFSQGDLGASGVKTFIIDHPLEPETKSLKHFSIESNEVLNIYRGVGKFDNNGNCIIQLPDYYNSINIEESYNLTAIGKAMPNIFISKKINSEGKFEISGGIKGYEVSWSVYAKRNDKYVQNHPEKTKDVITKKQYQKGKFWDPISWNKEKDKGIYNKRSIQEISKQKK